VTRSCDTHQTAQVHVLVADDDPVVRLVVEKTLQTAGYSVDCVADGKEVLSALKSRHYDLVLMDCRMPRMDGFTATRQIRCGDPGGTLDPKIPVIALTGLTNEENRTRCLDAGMNAYVEKSARAHTLIKAIERCLGIDGSEQAASGLDETGTGQAWDDELIDSLVGHFLEAAPQEIIDLQTAAGQGDLVRLQHIGHRLKGAADILEINSLSRRARALERAAGSGDLQRACRLSAQLVTGLQKLTDILNE